MLSSFLEDFYTASSQVFCKKYLGVGGHGMLYAAVIRLRYFSYRTGVLYTLQPDRCWLLTQHQSISSAVADISSEGWKNETEKVLSQRNSKLTAHLTCIFNYPCLLLVYPPLKKKVFFFLS